VSSFQRLLTLTVSTKRATVDGTTHKKGLPTTFLSGLKATPLDPAQTDVVLRMGLASPQQLLQTFVEGNYDIVHGDVLNVTSVDKGIATPYTIVGKDYPVQGVESFQWRQTAYTLLVVEYLIAPTP